MKVHLAGIYDAAAQCKGRAKTLSPAQRTNKPHLGFWGRDRNLDLHLVDNVRWIGKARVIEPLPPAQMPFFVKGDALL